GVEYFPRIIEAARLYKNGLADKVAINGNRKMDVLRQLERKGFKPCCPWDEDRKRILDVLGVPRKDVISISAEDAYDTITEAKAVGEHLLRSGIRRVIVTTSKYHTRRAQFVWFKLFKGRLEVFAVSAKTDPYDPKGWWKEGRQIRWVLAEYGAWIYYWLRK
ncbi:YdcF family protein, partial [Thermodesulfobacteriota bacterium]